MNLRAPKYSHHKARNTGKATIDGKTVYFPGDYGSTESVAAYDAAIAEWRKRQSARRFDGLTIGQAVVLFDEHARAYYVKDGRPTSECSLFKTAFRPLLAKYRRKRVSDFGPLDLKDVRQAYVDAGYVREKVNSYTRRIVRMVGWLVENEKCPPDVLVALKAVKGLRKGRTEAVESKPVRPVSDADVNAVLPYLSRQVRDMVRLQAVTAMRPGEVVQIRPCDINRDGDVWEFVPASHKTEHHDRERVVYLGPKAQAILSPWLDDRPADAPCFSPGEAEAERAAVMRANRKSKVQPSQQNRNRGLRKLSDRYDAQAYGRAIRRACESAGITPWSPNRLRHTAATVIRRNHGLEAAQVALGHSTASTTQIYAERDAELARRVAAAIG